MESSHYGIEEILESWCRANPEEAIMGLPPECTVVFTPVRGVLKVTAR